MQQLAVVARGYFEALASRHGRMKGVLMTPSDSSPPIPTSRLHGAAGTVDPWSLLEDFASVVGHELRTPLTVVKAAAETALLNRDELGHEGIVRLLEMIMRNSDLALLLVNRIDLARDIESNSVGLAREQIDLAVLVAESVGDLHHVVLGGHSVEVTGADSLVVSGDPTALREIVFNLLANAAKYSAADAPIEVRVERKNGNAEVVIRDHGIGVTVDDTETIFGRFYQGDPGSPGAGLGLYISRGLARAHDGDIRVRRAERGSEFILVLPV